MMNPLQEAVQLLGGTPVERADPRYNTLLVLTSYSLMFSGDANLIHREHPNVVQLLRETQGHPQFRDVVLWLGLSEVERLVQFCLDEDLFTSRAKIFRNVPISFYCGVVLSSTLFRHIPLEKPLVHEIPLPIQIGIRTWMYRVVEESCWDFAAPRIPQILRNNKWTDPIAVELKKWQSLFLRGAPSIMLAPHLDYTSFQNLPVSNRPKFVEDTFSTLRELRNLAVHRESLPVDTMLTSSMAAINLMKLLGDRRGEKFFVALQCKLNDWKPFLRQMMESTRVALRDDLMEKLGLPRDQVYFCRLSDVPLQFGKSEALKAWQAREDAKQNSGKRLFEEVRELLKDFGPLAGGDLCLKIEKLQEELEAVNAAQETQNAAQKVKVKDLSLEIEKLQEKLKAANAALEEEIAAHRTEYTDQEVELCRLRAENDFQSLTGNNLRRETKQLKGVIDAHKAKYDASEVKVAAQEGEIRRLHAENNSQSLAERGLREQLENVIAARDVEVCHLRAEKDSFLDELASSQLLNELELCRLRAESDSFLDELASSQLQDQLATSQLLDKLVLSEPDSSLTNVDTTAAKSYEGGEAEGNIGVEDSIENAGENNASSKKRARDSSDDESIRAESSVTKRFKIPRLF